MDGPSPAPESSLHIPLEPSATPGPHSDHPRARQLSCFSDYKNEPLVCPLCGWKGTWAEGSHEIFESLIDCSCPACPSLDAPMLAIVASPAPGEWEAHRASVDPAEMAFVDAQVAFQNRFKEVSLKRPDQLPMLPDGALELTWEMEDKDTVLRHGSVEVWREPALWDGYLRFREILPILRAGYGPRLRDVVPTTDSMLYLLGDQLAAGACIAEARARLWEAGAPEEG